MPRGMLGLGLFRRQKHWAKGAPRRGEGTLILNSWSWWLGPEITRWQVNIHFCVKDVSVWGRLFLLSRGQWWPTTVLLPGITQRRRGLVVHGFAKSRTRLSEFTFTFHFPELEKVIATHSNVLAWKIPGTVEPSGLLSMGLHRIGHDWRDLAAAAAPSELRESTS